MGFTSKFGDSVHLYIRISHLSVVTFKLRGGFSGALGFVVIESKMDPDRPTYNRREQSSDHGSCRPSPQIRWSTWHVWGAPSNTRISYPAWLLLSTWRLLPRPAAGMQVRDLGKNSTERGTEDVRHRFSGRTTIGKARGRYEVRLTPRNPDNRMLSHRHSGNAGFSVQRQRSLVWRYLLNLSSDITRRPLRDTFCEMVPFGCRYRFHHEEPGSGSNSILFAGYACRHLLLFGVDYQRALIV